MTAYDDQNIFARILRGEIPCHRVYEDAATLAFMDVMPQSPGHVLVIPRTPARNLLDADAAHLAPLIVASQRIARAAMAAFSADGITIMQFNEASGGQSVFHLHFHVIPRYEGRPMKPHGGGMEKPEILAANADMLKAALAPG